jgi:hypothetical protein
VTRASRRRTPRKTEYDNITTGSATPQMITIYTDVTRQQLLTMTNFEAKLRTVLAAKVARREDVLLTTTVLGTPGIQTLDMAAADPDALLEAAGMIAAGDVAAEPNLALVHPTDLAAIVGVDVGAGGRASADLGSFLPDVQGMRIYPTTAVTAGDILVGAWSAAAGSWSVSTPPTSSMRSPGSRTTGSPSCSRRP